jgi:polysaccharide pyruvyl transferase WcaK-like protein
MLDGDGVTDQIWGLRHYPAIVCTESAGEPLERSASRKVGSLHRFIILRAESSLELMQDTQTAHASGEEADRSSSVSLEDLAWSRRVRGSLRSCGLRRDSRFETAQLGRE